MHRGSRLHPHGNGAVRMWERVGGMGLAPAAPRLLPAPQPGPPTSRKGCGSPVGGQHHCTASPSLLHDRVPQEPLGAGIHPGAGLILKERAHDDGCWGCTPGHAGPAGMGGPRVGSPAARLHDTSWLERTAHPAAPSTSVELPNNPPRKDRPERKKASPT